MKCLIVFYSRKGTTKKIAEIISDKIDCELEEIIDTKNRMGFIGWLKAGYDATREKLTIIKHNEFRFPHESKVLPDGSKVVLASTYANKVFIIDRRNRKVNAFILFGKM